MKASIPVPQASQIVGPLADSLERLLEQLPKNVGASIEQTLSAMLSEAAIQESLVEFFSNLHTHVQESEPLRGAIDSLAHVQGFGGAAFHRVTDGQHTLAGAMDAIRAACPDSVFAERLGGAFAHLWADFNSATGIPVVAFNGIENFSNFCETLRISPHTVQDFLTINSSELLGSALAVIPALFRFNEMQAAEFAALAGKLGILAAFGGSQAEAISGLFSMAMLGKAYFMSIHDGEAISEILLAAIKEGSWTGGSITLVAITPFPFSIAAVFALTRIRMLAEAHGIEGVRDFVAEYTPDFRSWVSEADLAGSIKST